MKNNKTNILLIVISLLSLEYLGADLSKSPTTGDWIAILLLEMSLQILYTNYKN
jgi:hypothetical protein